VGVDVQDLCLQRQSPLKNEMTDQVACTTEKPLIQSRLFAAQRMSATQSRWAFWLTKGTLAVLDQALISTSNFAIGIFLARWLTPAKYGAYTLAFSIFLLLSFFHQALILEPQRVFGSADYAECLPKYLAVLIRVQSGLTLLAGVVFVASLWLAHSWARPDGLDAALIGMTIAAPFVLLLWLVRGAFYVQMAPQFAVVGSAAYCAIVLGTLLVAERLRMMSPFLAFIMMGFGALVSSVVLLNRLRPNLNLRAAPNWKGVSRKHWDYGRWLLASLALGWIPGNIYYSLVTAFSGIASAGELKALINFTLPVAQTLTALSMCIVPHAARAYQKNGITELKKLTLKTACVFGFAVVVYWAILVLSGVPLLRFLYNGHYTHLASLIPWVAAGSIPWNLATIPTLALRAVRSSVSIFRIYLASSGIAVLIGVPATRSFGLRGALGGIIASNVAALFLALYLMRRELRIAQAIAA
jgi:O-antigen/teichoic acid export membrane protein